MPKTLVNKPTKLGKVPKKALTYTSSQYAGEGVFEATDSQSEESYELATDEEHTDPEAKPALRRVRTKPKAKAQPDAQPDSQPKVARQRRKPKNERVLTKYNIFVKENAPEVKKQHPDMKPAQRLQLIAKMWSESKK